MRLCISIFIRGSVSRSVGNKLPVRNSELLDQKGDHHVYTVKKALVYQMNGMMKNHVKSRQLVFKTDLTDRQTAGISDIRVKEVSQNTCIDRLIPYTISPWSKIAEKRDFKRGVTDRWTDRRTDRQTHGQTLLQRCEDASKNPIPAILCGKVRRGKSQVAKKLVDALVPSITEWENLHS